MTREFIITKEFDRMKNEKANLSKSERNPMKTIVTAIKKAEKEVQDGRK